RAGQPRFNRHVSRARAEIEHDLTASQTQRANRAPAPQAIDPGAQQMVEKIVPRSDRVEHSADARRGPRYIGVLAHSISLFITKSRRETRRARGILLKKSVSS